MKNLRQLFAIALTITLFAPYAMAVEENSTDKPLSIMDAEIYTRQGLLNGSVTVCNDNSEATRFSFQAWNLDINTLYHRNFKINAKDCDKFQLRFTEAFSIMANTEDTVKIAIKRIKGLSTKVNFDDPDDEFTTIVEGKGTKEGCLDSHGDDGSYLACKGDFIYHESGLRIRVLYTDSRYADIMVNGLRWGGNFKYRIRKGASKELYVGENPSTLVKLNSVLDPANRHLFNVEVVSY